ncbi:MAG: hypothetical protein ACLUIH_10130 [Eubacterium sp.]
MDLKSSKGEYVFDDKFNPPKKIISETEKKITPQEAEKQRKIILEFLENMNK